jgi:type IV secretion system protein TrbI
VNFHWGSLAKAALISTVLGVGAELGSGSDDTLVRALRTGTQDSINQAGQEMVRRQLTIPPTLTIRSGFPVRVIVTRDLILAPVGVAP